MLTSLPRLFSKHVIVGLPTKACTIVITAACSSGGLCLYMLSPNVLAISIDSSASSCFA